MNIFVIGSSISALFFSIYLKKNVNNINITILDKEDKIAKKLYATGNGRCNIANLKYDNNSYDVSHESKFFKEYFDSSKIIEYFQKELGICFVVKEDSYVYPSSLSAKDFTNFLINKAKDLGINFILNEKLIDYKANEKIEVYTDKNKYICDKLYLACGGKSSPKLGSDGSIFNILKKHNYEISPLHAGLTPLKIQEKLNEIENERINAKVSIFYKDNLIYSENGEVLFKKDRISGIVSFNCSSIIKRFLNDNKNIDINSFSINVLPLELEKLNNNELIKLFNINKEDFLNGIFTNKISNYFLKISNLNKDNLNESNISKLIENIKNYKYHYVFDDDFESSQVTIGGVTYDNLIDYTMESNFERNVYFIGEILASDGLCGGYNISMCISMAKYAADLLLKEIS